MSDENQKERHGVTFKTWRGRRVSIGFGPGVVEREEEYGNGKKPEYGYLSWEEESDPEQVRTEG